jgi:hypothetical protein
MYGQNSQFCQRYNGSDTACAWPGTLKIDLTKTGGSFEGSWLIFQPTTVALPGGPRAWPLNVTDSLNGQTATQIPVANDSGPKLFLSPGLHVIKGQWSWPELPDTLTLPLVGLIKVTVDGQEKIFAHQEINYQDLTILYWLKDPAPQSPETTLPSPPKVGEETDREADQLKVSIDRLIQDDQPMVVLTRLKLSVSGQRREEVINNVLLPNTQITRISSPLPARLVGQSLRVQVRPGVHSVSLTAILNGPVEELGPVGEAYGPENWAVQLNPDLRQAEVSGAPQVDASQVDIPWKRFPIYALEPGQSLTIKTIRRGDPEPGPDQLSLRRQCWLDYNGQGLSCRDQLTGTMRRGWQLSADPPFNLAQASLSGQPQVLTWQINSKGQRSPGLQVRQGRLRVTADLRLENFNSVLPASGWDHNLESSAQHLSLPPGYQLFHVQGARASNSLGRPTSWWDRWNTLDLFIVLAIFLSALKLRGRGLALLALAAMALSYHEFMSPRLVILHIFGALALLKVLPPKGVAQALTKTWFYLAALFLVLTTVTFLILQVRITMYPQLENAAAYQPGSFGYPMSEAFYDRSWIIGGASAPSGYYDEDNFGVLEEVAEPNEYREQPKPTQRAREVDLNKNGGRSDQVSRSFRRDSPPPPAASPSFINQSSLAQPNPEAIAQNSLARPNWNWQTISLDFNGQVTRDQEVKIYLIRPPLRFALGLLRVILMTALALYLLRLGPLPRLRPEGAAPTAAAPTALAVILALALGLGLFSQSAAAQETWPPATTLNELRNRLLAPPPNQMPAGVPIITVTAESDKLAFAYQVEATVPAAILLPILDANIFQPTSLTLANGENLPLYVASDEEIYTLVPAGVSKFVYVGRLKKTDSFQIRLPASLEAQKIQILGADWEVSGLDAYGYPTNDALFLTRRPTGTAPTEPVETTPVSPSGDLELPSPEPNPLEETGNQVIEPFYHVTRTISLGLEWKALTTVNLNDSVDHPVTLRLPLIPGESLISNFPTRNGQVILNFSPSSGQRSITFESLLDQKQSSINLEAHKGPYAETWILDASTLWRVEPKGLTPIHNISSSGYWNPQWRPWPGEKLTIQVSRPEPVPGTYLVADQANLQVDLGERNRRVELSLTLRSSRGGHHSFRLPPGAEIQTLAVNNQTQPISSAQSDQGPLVTIPLVPGELRVELTWLSPEKLTTLTRIPKLDLGLETANITITVKAPEDRFVLLAGGPTQGPAVLFWSLAGALLILSALLAKTKLTPLGLISWFLLFIGLSQLNLQSAFLVAGWLLVLGLRGKRNTIKSPGLFNLAQIGLFIWTIIALALIYQGLKHGLLENPSMRVTGNGSYGTNLIWFQDRVAGAWPQAWCLTMANSVYHYIMLAWALWLAISIIRWLVWGWKSFSAKALWKSSPPRPKPGPKGPTPPKGATSDPATGVATPEPAAVATPETPVSPAPAPPTGDSPTTSPAGAGREEV